MASSVLLQLLLLGFLHKSATIPVNCDNLEFVNIAGYTKNAAITVTVRATASGTKLTCEFIVPSQKNIAEAYAVVVTPTTITSGKVEAPTHLKGQISGNAKLAWEECTGHGNHYLKSTAPLLVPTVSFTWTADDSIFTASTTSAPAQVFAVICQEGTAPASKECSAVTASARQTLTKSTVAAAIPVNCANLEFVTTGGYEQNKSVTVQITAVASKKTITCTVSAQQKRINEIFVVAKSVIGDSSPTRVSGLLNGVFSDITPRIGVGQETCSAGSRKYLKSSVGLNVQSAGFKWEIDDSHLTGSSVSVQVYAVVCFADVSWRQSKCSPIKSSEALTLRRPDYFNHRVRRRRRPRQSTSPTVPAIGALVTVIALVAASLVLGFPGGHFLVVASAVQ